MTPYIVGRRVNTGASRTAENENPRAEDSGNIGAGPSSGCTRLPSWSVATFGAGAILGWYMASSRKSRRRAWGRCESPPHDDRRAAGRLG